MRLDCPSCPLFQLESQGEACLHVNRPGGLELTRQALDRCGLRPGARLLEVASGASASLAYVTDVLKLQAVGVDLSLDMLRLGRAMRPDLGLIQADARRTPLAPAGLDAVLIECALSLLGGADGALTEFNRLLAPGGKLAVTDIYLREVSDPDGLQVLSTTCCLGGARTEDQIREGLRQAGFEVCVWQDCTPLFKGWLAGIVFKLGSLQAFYRSLVGCSADAEALGREAGKKFKLGYYWLVAEKT